ncbi:MAG TPA: hypothetical protein VE934_11940 [Polaromonas sp.]|uniref:hypothetical protein n=1 Tax=Polaromonas sp. TaxID=1869339 RepID=UPI002D5FBDDB|nr:hypothetical protein [Polaromonas sp.]HYW57666.1 hypothetical protein [Polaromonas sp.]
MTKSIGTNFPFELKQAGLAGLPFSWTHDGELMFDEAMTPGQIAAVQAVYTDHDPTATPEISAIEQIRAIEAAPNVQDAMARALRRDLLTRAFAFAKARAVSKGYDWTDVQVHAWAMANDKDYKTLREAEDAIKPLRG